MSWAGFGEVVARGAAVAIVIAAMVSTGTAAGTAAPRPVAQAHTQAHTQEHRPLITMGRFRAEVSPNGDGYHDGLRIPFTVRKWSSVNARVVDVDSGRTVYNGCVTSGDHVCEFGRGTYALRLAALRTGGGRPWEPGTYRVQLVARSYSDVESDRARASFELFPGTVRADRREIAFSPNDDGIHDRARIVFTLERRARLAAFLHPQSDGGPGGEVRLGVRGRGTATWTWDGRVGGVVVPDGRYELELRARPVSGKHRAPGADEVALSIRTSPSRPPV